ncbi:response regulator transcription factor [Aurantimonas sp. A2-1-M11]|uniref:response regulator transcription factor n=1 Tax=Aurantimonas sp. A2-1-M11 TaxID=3113712 RepID=UPI002F952BC8
MKRHILVVDDDETLRGLLAFCLEQEGHRVVCVGSAKEMRAQLEARDPDLVLLDLGLPDEEGLVLARQLRARSTTPIMVLTGNLDQDVLLAALELGVDEFLRKPFDPRELILRANAVLARGARSTSTAPAPSAPLLHFDGWTLDLRARSLRCADKGEVALTPGEFNVLSALVKRPAWALSRDQLLDAVSSGDDPPSARMIDVFISQLRAKMEADPKRPKLILSVRGHGYRFGGSVEAVS